MDKTFLGSEDVHSTDIRPLRFRFRGLFRRERLGHELIPVLFLGRLFLAGVPRCATQRATFEGDGGKKFNYRTSEGEEGVYECILCIGCT